MFRKLGGGAFQGFGCVIYGIAGLVGVAINISVVMEATGWGFFAVVLAIMFFPVTLAAAPLYALIAWGDLMPLVVSWGGGGGTSRVPGQTVRLGRRVLLWQHRT